jgi:hypothetical protein
MVNFKLPFSKFESVDLPRRLDRLGLVVMIKFL